MVRVVVEEHSHSNTRIVLEGGEEVIDKNYACYSHVWSGHPGMAQLFLHFHERGGSYKEYVEWVVNSKLFGGGFKTKSFDEGVENGFEVNIHQPTNYLFMCFSAIRYPWEADVEHSVNYYDGYYYPEFRKAGFTKKQSFFLMNNFILDEEGCISENHYNSNHIPIPRGVPYKHYKLANFRKQKGSMIEGAESKGVSRNWLNGRWQYGSPDLGEVGVRSGDPFNQETIQRLKNYFKGV